MFGINIRVMMAETIARPDPIQKTPYAISVDIRQLRTYCVSTICAGTAKAFDDIWESISSNECTH